MVEESPSIDCWSSRGARIEDFSNQISEMTSTRDAYEIAEQLDDDKDNKTFPNMQEVYNRVAEKLIRRLAPLEDKDERPIMTNLFHDSRVHEDVIWSLYSDEQKQQRRREQSSRRSQAPHPEPGAAGGTAGRAAGSASAPQTSTGVSGASPRAMGSQIQSRPSSSGAEAPSQRSRSEGSKRDPRSASRSAGSSDRSTSSRPAKAKAKSNMPAEAGRSPAMPDPASGSRPPGFSATPPPTGRGHGAKLEPPRYISPPPPGRPVEDFNEFDPFDVAEDPGYGEMYAIYKQQRGDK